jgi:hypothetical protein
MKPQRTDRQWLAEDYGIVVPPHVADATIKKAMDDLAVHCASMSLPMGSAFRGFARLQNYKVDFTELGQRLREAIGNE